MDEPKVKSFDAATASGSTITYHASNIPPSENKKPDPDTTSDPRISPSKHSFLYDARVRIGLIIGVGAIICLAIFLSGITSGNTSTPQSVSANIYLRLASISRISGQYAPSIQSSRLRALNTDLSDNVSNTLNTFSSLFNTLEFKPTNISAKISAAELQDYNRLTATLDDAIATNTFEVTYVHMMSSQLTLLSNRYKKLSSLVKDQDVKKHAADAIADFASLGDRFSALAE